MRLILFCLILLNLHACTNPVFADEDLDLSFDGFELIIPELSVDVDLSFECSTLGEDLEKFKSVMLANQSENVSFGHKLSEVFVSWSEKLNKKVGTKLSFEAETLKPIESLLQILKSASRQINNNNGIASDELLFALSDVVYDCEDLPGEWLASFDEFQLAWQQTNSALGLYVRTLQFEIDEQYNELNSWVGIDKKLFTQSALDKLNRAASSKIMSGGSGEAFYWYNKKHDEVYLSWIDRLIADLSISIESI